MGCIEVHSTHYACAHDKGQSAYPLYDFMELIFHEVTLKDGSTKVQTIKCTRNAAASIALVCSESSYEQATLILNRLAGFELTDMTELRVIDSIGTEFIKKPPTEIDFSRIAELNEKMSGNILESRVNQMCHPDNKGEIDEIIQKALKNGPDGILYKDYYGPTIKVMYIQCDGTGVPGRRQELAGVKGKQSDGSAKTFESKIGAIFIMEYTADGKPLLKENGEMYRDKKVSYMGTVRKVDDFGPMLYQHAIENGLNDMDAVIFLGDGAKWLWNIQNEYFPFALTGVDLYHSIGRVNDMVEHIKFNGRTCSDRKKTFKEDCIELLRCGKVQDMLDRIEAMSCKEGKEKKLESDMGYFRSNMDRMNYGAFTASGICVGSGVIEAGCKVIVGNRMKNAGMHWLKDSAEKMIAIRCAIRNDEFFPSYLGYTMPSSSSLLSSSAPAATCVA
jgi:hypothetical protein